MALKFSVSVLLLALLPWGPAAAQVTFVPEPYKAEYTVHANGFKVGEMVRQLRNGQNGTLVLESRLYTTGLVSLFKSDELTEKSTWRLGSGDYIPLLYRSEYTGRAEDTVEQLRFNWPKQTVFSLRDGEETPVPVHPGVLDKLIYQVALRRDLARGERHLQYDVADRGKVESYEFDVIGEEQVVTNLGTYRTLKVKKGTTTLWVAPALNYLVVQLLQEEDDYTLASYITDLEPSTRRTSR